MGSRVWLAMLFVLAIGGSFLMTSNLSCDEHLNAKSLPEVESRPNFKLLADSQDLTDESDLFYFQVFGEKYVTNFSELEKYKNRLPEADRRRPYLGDWFAESKGGTNIAGALDRYDKAFNKGAPLAADWERLNHNSTEGWFGHCNGYSAAASRHRDHLVINGETRNMTKVSRPEGCKPPAAGCVEFSPDDIKALLAEVYMTAKARFLGGKRCALTKEELRNPEIRNQRPELRVNVTELDECDDVDPGVFHIGIINWIGIQKQNLVFDVAWHAEVWNYPVYDYKYEVVKKLTAKEAYELVAKEPAGDKYLFNPAAVSFYHIKMTLFYAKADPHPDAKYVHNDYEYILELDETDKIIGGEWTKIWDTEHRHPDFFWIPFEPYEPSGSRKTGNPHVDTTTAIQLWAESLGLDPADPFADPNYNTRILFAPKSVNEWGKFQPYFSISLDGSKTGTVFLGGKIHLNVERHERLIGDATVEISVNNKVIETRNVTGAEDAKFEFDPPPGISTLTFKWTVGGREVKIAGKSFRFYAMP